jgi:phage-related protein
LKERTAESRLRILPFVLGKTKPGSSQLEAFIRSSRCLARCALRTSTVRGPMWILLTLPVLVVETRVFVQVSAERLRVMEDPLLPLIDTAYGVIVDTMNGVGRGGWRWVYYKAASGRVPVREFIDEQSAEVREKIFFDLERLVRFNIKLGSPYVEKIEGRDFWELRTKLGGDIYRTFYFAHTGKKFVLLHAYHKKSQKAPKRELDTAEERMKDYLERTKRR